MYAGNSHGCVNPNRKRCIAYNSWAHLLAVFLPRFVMRQDVALGLLIQDVNIVVCHVDNPGPQAARINHHRGG